MRRITTPNDGETPLAQWQHDGVTVARLPDDPICPRASIGGVPGREYLVFRGEPTTITELLRRALTAIEA